MSGVKETLLYQFIRNKMKKKRDVVILVCGEQRNGKTFDAIFWANLIDKNFDLRQQMVVNCDDFLDRFKKFKRRNIIYDEAGKDLDPMRAMSDINRAVAIVLQSQAYKGNIVWIITPFMDDIAPSSLKHIRCVVEMVGRGHYVLWKPIIRHVSFNRKNKTIFGEIMEEMYGIPEPPADIVKIYRTEFEKDVKEDILDQQIERLKRGSKAFVGGLGERVEL